MLMLLDGDTDDDDAYYCLVFNFFDFFDFESPLDKETNNIHTFDDDN